MRIGKTPRSRARLTVLLGVLLLVSPYVLSGVTLGAPTHHYSVAYVETTEDGGYDATGAAVGPIDEDVLCWASVSRHCHLEALLLEENVSVEVGIHAFDSFVDYSYVYHDGTFYDVEASDDTLWLRRVDATTALDRTAGPSSSLPSDVASALGDGREGVATRSALPTHQLIEVGDGRYATLRHDSSDRGLLDHALNAVDSLLGPAGFLLGLALVLTGQKWRMRARFRNR